MPRYEITGPDGLRYEVEAPEGTSEQDVMTYAQSQLGQGGEGQQPQDQGYLSGLVDSFTNISGFGDELTAAEAALLGRTPEGGWFDYNQPFGERYSRALDAERQQNARFRDEYPVSSTAAEIAGNVAAVAATPLAMAGAPIKGATLPANMLRGAGAGAGFGAAYGFGSGEGGAGERAGSAAFGAGLGAIGGAAVPAITTGAGKVANRVLSSRAANSLGMSKPTYNTLRNTMADDTAIGGGARRIAAAGDDAMLADAGPGSANLLDAVAQYPGGRQVAIPAVSQRAGAANTQAAAALDDALLRGRGATGSASAIRSSTAGARGRAYREAYETAIDYASQAGRELDDLLARVPSRAVSDANRLLSIEGLPPITRGAKPNVQQLDYIKRALDGMARSGDGQGALGGQTPLGGAYQSLARAIRDKTAEAVPAYRTALSTAADPIRRKQALDFGYKLLRPGVSRKDVLDEVAGMTPAERNEAAFAVRDFISDVTANVRKAQTDANLDARQAYKALSDLSTENARAKVAALIGDDAASGLFGELDRLGMAFQVRAAVAQNSKTAPRQLFNDAMREQTEDGIINAVRQGEPVNLAKSAWQRVTGATPADRQRVAEKSAEEMARMLTGVRGKEAQTLAQRLMADSNALPARVDDVQGRLARLLMSGRPGVAPALQPNQR